MSFFLWPAVCGPFVVVDGEFCEAGGGHAFAVLGRVREGAAEVFAGLGEVVAPFFEGCAAEGIVVAGEWEDAVDDLEPAAGGDVSFILGPC